MKNKTPINKQVEDTFKALDSIEKVQVNHFFKHKVLQKLKAEKDVKQTIFSWFTPQLQFASLALIVLLNASAIFYSYNSVDLTSSESALKTFAQEYSLQSIDNSILN